MKSKASEDIDAGHSITEIRGYLLDAGFSESHIDAILRDASSTVAATNRGYGLQRVALGVFALVVAGVLNQYLVGPGSFRWIGRLAAAFGIAAIISGLYTAFTGKEHADRRTMP